MHSIVCACPRFSIAFILCLRKVEGQDQAESNIFRQNSGNATQRSESSDGLRDGLRIHHLSGRLFGSVKTHASRLKLLAKCCLRASSKVLAKCSCGVGCLGVSFRFGEVDQSVLDSVDVVGELGEVDAGIERGESLTFPR